MIIKKSTSLAKTPHRFMFCTRFIKHVCSCQFSAQTSSSHGWTGNSSLQGYKQTHPHHTQDQITSDVTLQWCNSTISATNIYRQLEKANTQPEKKSPQYWYDSSGGGSATRNCWVCALNAVLSWLWRLLEYSELIVTFFKKKNCLRWVELCDMVHSPAGISHQKMGCGSGFLACCTCSFGLFTCHQTQSGKNKGSGRCWGAGHLQ